MRKTLETKVSKDMRSKTTQNSFVEKLKKEYAFKDKSKKGLKWFYENLDSTYYSGNFDPTLLTGNKILFTLDGLNFNESNFAQFLKSNYRGVRQEKNEIVVNKQYSVWQKKEILAYEESKLTVKYPAFKALITEYHDGILLYEVMSDMVWNKAMKDTIGLQQFYDSNKENYQWGNRVDAEIFECYSDEFANAAYELLQNDTIQSAGVVSEINKDSELNIRYRNEKFDISRTSYLKDRELGAGLNAPYEVDGKFYIIVVNEKLDPTQKEFSESKGAVTSDYQNYLEKNWLTELNEQHAVTIYDTVLYSIGE
jgi:peptidyl-prolyl cis-trans isomerase SurA